jgi:hypothetical protein
MAQTVGANLTVVDTPSGWDWIQKKGNLPAGRGTLAHGLGFQRIFATSSGAPAGSTVADSPGQSFAWIIDTANSNVYFVHQWVSSTQFECTQVTS